MLPRKISFQDAENDSVFLWGARQTGKSTLLKALYPEEPYIDLLKSDEFERYSRRPALCGKNFPFFRRTLWLS